jgi:mannose/fructose/N-acetylgalactosamine-specific phosphotransferase system component IIB
MISAIRSIHDPKHYAMLKDEYVRNVQPIIDKITEIHTLASCEIIYWPGTGKVEHKYNFTEEEESILKMLYEIIEQEKQKIVTY